MCPRAQDPGGAADTDEVIRIRRVPARLPLGHVYEVEVATHGMPRNYKRTRTPNWLLEPILGRADTCEFVQEADRSWARGETDWAIEFDEDSLPRR